MNTDQFWAMVEIREPEECWPWKGGRRVRDYGGARFAGKSRLASHIAFFLTHGYWPDYTRHSCDNPPCCNPTHVLDGDHQMNMDDKVARSRQARGAALKQSDLTEDQVRAIRFDLRPQSIVALKYEIDPSNVCRIRTRKTWRHVA